MTYHVFDLSGALLCICPMPDCPPVTWRVTCVSARMLFNMCQTVRYLCVSEHVTCDWRTVSAPVRVPRRVSDGGIPLYQDRTAIGLEMSPFVTDQVLIYLFN